MTEQIKIEISGIIEGLEWDEGAAATTGDTEEAAKIRAKIEILKSTEGESTHTAETRAADDALETMKNLILDGDFYASTGYGITAEIVRKRASVLKEGIDEANKRIEEEAKHAPYVPYLDEWTG